jgi:hypothetical protein
MKYIYKMADSFVPVLVEDDRLMLSNPKDFNFEVYQGAASVAPQVFTANSNTPSSLTFSVTVPSYESITDLNVMIDTDIEFTITAPTPSSGTLVNLGTTDCIAPFPFHQNILVASATINQSQCSVNVQDVLPALLPMISRESLSMYNSMTPTTLDNVQSYAQGGYSASQASVFNSYYASNNYREQPRGAWAVKSITTTATGGVTTVKVVVHVTEPLLLSPFLFGKKGAGISGVQAINLVLTLDSSAQRSWRSMTTAPANISITGYNGARLLVNFLSPKASQLVKYSPRCINPYSQLLVYKSDEKQSGTDTTFTMNTPSIQLSSVPSMALLFVRPVARTCVTADFTVPISSVNVQFNGRNGLLSGCTPQQIYAMSCLAGVNQSWQEWSGLASGAVTNAVNPIYTQGPICAFQFARDLECSDTWVAPSSIGQFNLQVNVGCSWPQGVDTKFVLYMVLVNDGFIASERGQTSTFTSILSKSTVLSVVDNQAISDAPLAQSLPNEGSEIITGGRRRVHHAKRGMDFSSESSSGAGISGGMMSGAGRSGGKLHNRIMK